MLARGLLERVVSAVADDRLSIDALAVTMSLQGDLEAAGRHWQRLLRIQPVDETTLLSLALVYERQGDRIQALSRLTELAHANPWNPQFHAERGRILAGLRQYSEAVAEARRVVEIDPSSAGHFRQLAGALRSAGLVDEAAQAEKTADRLTEP
jgi:tetratricopeptide (TPR) repeat protein